MSAPPPPDRETAELRAFLADRDVACPGCGYNLRGLAGDECPECGARARLALAALPPRLRSARVPIVGILLLVGWSVAVVAGMLVTGPWIPWIYVALHSVIVIVGITGLALSVPRRNSAPEVAWWWAGITLLVVGVALVGTYLVL